MEGLFRLLLVAGLLAAVLPAAAATFGPQPGPPCEPTLLATQVALFCAPYMPSAQCCEPVVAAVDLRGGVPCLCRVAAEPQPGLNATHLLTLYTSCGGLRPGGAHLAAACEGPASVVSVPLPSSGPRRKQPADEAPPLPPSTEKLSPPPQQHDGAAHSKAVLAYVATSPLAPVAAISLAAPHPPHSAVSFELISTAADGLSNGCVHVQDFSTAIAVQCGLAPSEEHCCTILRRVIDPAEVDICICLISQQEAIKQSGLTARHIVQSYATCRHIRPGDVHFSSRGCLKGTSPIPPTWFAPSAPASWTSPSWNVPPAVGTPPAPTSLSLPTRTAPPAAGTPTASSPSTGSNGILVAIFFALVFIILMIAAAAILLWRRGHFGWMQMPCSYRRK